MLLDTASLYFRAFYGVPDSMRAPTGEPVNAVRGLLDMIARLATEFQPTEIVACWDDDWRPQWRVDLIPTYKTHRVAAEPSVAADPAIEVVPDLLTPQVPIIREVLTALGIPIIGAAQHEADDVIGTLASHSSIPVDIITGDRDLFQLVDDTRDVRVIYTGRGMARLELLTDATLTTKTGVTPAQYADFAAMRGDASDGLPGVAGVGEKTAATLLAEYGDLDGIVAAAADPDVKLGASVRAKILAAADYLTVAPTVVNVVRDLDLPDFDARIRPSTPEQNAELEQLSARWGLSSSMQRAREALAALV
ncbi:MULTISPECIES: 5'-3' exonuclease [Cryobacterium]|uniref:5'-3' exonuclease n=1 Tax=Cryobacterium zongtaii TaxID=1259217 RepID=A0A2S3ZGW6_9MICO|nr:MULTISPECIES: 5'-3' exonuclease [Cryobacterium]POH63668.1 flap endonuclease [Cryobacterium zongtaii]POH66627.1 flap endonuclease [Cryobacterium zongtaii]TFC40922.1 5'-3' exonuclease [Cryobacterium sp. TMN-39-2]